MSDLLLWTDLETTGSNEEKDCIIEIGCVLTNADLSPIYPDGSGDPEIESLVQPTDEGLGRLIRNETVRTMHQDSGLLDAIVAYTLTQPQWVAQSILAFLTTHGAQEGKVVICGSGVSHFDRRFIRKYMPQLDRFCRYWHIDTGVIRRAHEYFLGVPGPNMNNGKTHRALVDAQCHLAEARAYQRLWKAHGLVGAYPEVAPAGQPITVTLEQVRSGDYFAGPTWSPLSAPTDWPTL